MHIKIVLTAVIVLHHKTKERKRKKEEKRREAKRERTNKKNCFQDMFKKLQVLNTKEDPNEVSMEAEVGDLCVHDGRLWHRVAMSPHVGKKSHRRVMYVSLLSGPTDERNEKSKTPFYLRFLRLAK